MERCLAASALACAAWLPTIAGGVFYNSNQSAEYIRSFDRNSAVDDADIVHYNMAGTVCLRPGLTLNLSNQTLLQWATVRTLGNPVLGDALYGGEPSDQFWLHAWKLTLEHPVTGRTLALTAPPARFQAAPAEPRAER